RPAVSSASVGEIAFIGGTGPEGLGLALRFAAAGERVVIGSRTADRASAVADQIRATVAGAEAHGCENLEAAARADRVFLTVPAAALPSFLSSARERLGGKLVVDVVVPVVLRGRVFEIAPLFGAGSAGELVQQAVPSARVVSAFKNLSAERLKDVGTPLEGDVVVCGNDPTARAEVARLVRTLPQLRAVEADGIVNARYLEAITALLLNLNRRYHAQTSIAVLGLP